MKNIKKLFFTFVAIFTLVLLVACSNISKSYADKIDKAAEKKEYITYEQAMDDLGDEAVSIVVAKTGVIIAVKGCKSLEDIKAKIDDGKTIKGIVITVLLGNCTDAEYREITADDLKSK
ncbi:MAG: hypothetical protein ACI35S_03150 [Anaeroplasma sp.]